MYQNPLLWIVLVVGGAVGGYYARQAIGLKKKNNIEQIIERQIDEAKVKAKEIVLEGQERASALVEEAKREERERKSQIDRMEERLVKKEESFERDLHNVRTKENRLNEEATQLKAKEGAIEDLKRKAEDLVEKSAGLTTEQAREIIIKRTQEAYQKDLVQMVQKLEHERVEELEKKSLDILTTAIQRYSRSHVAEVTTSIFHLPNEDLKGKIIGREGRNIKALERLTGVEFIIDEAPDYIVISSFDPMRREVAGLTLEKLLKDGRIQPARIEEKVEESKNELTKRAFEIGEQAAHEVGIYDLPKELIQLLGRLHFRTSYGQNALVHSIEAAHLAGMIASELGINADVSRKAALLHDIGKAIDHEVAGSHVELGQKILKKYNISEKVIQAMESHHEDYPFASPEAYVVAATDALSAARPGARRENIDNYIKRLEELEKIAGEFSGVKQAYAISAGRELRIFVTPEKMDDFAAFQLAHDVANKIEAELKYPGEIKVVVIREMRAVEYAR
ncbi:ribonuclease Y [Candidatus Wolfebacteria bacterium RIFOXYD12_FULL_48_21]|uniref:Ribonuclease Y n=1 Tax=Candidatus Wolfebacteria bacterium RIFOXYD1_FULL_48_65 TaxID=1802561 RepID=A0A1F8E243_9BACT|nr:MAG: ribonuclease Y [Candidatus Wolfebacteria bacterium RIFOXYD12_FULL_48_21]OGM94807.1 MAG: ribonuclease Y [Candidatus Wolfebacteria bacterium RIFOXYD1_FULL_48_65]OGM97197.1 MAG: ribonuclease Y [Candidatus Wolfebacteria bacterium RIFOXYD2_FULL_48_11]